MSDEISHAEPNAPAGPDATPNHTETAAGGGSHENAARPGRRVLWIVVLLLILTSLAVQMPREVSRWNLAAAREKYALYERQAVAARRLRAQAEKMRAENAAAADSLDTRAAELEDDAEQAFQAAVGLVQRAAEWAPDDLELDQQLGQWYFQAEKYDLSRKYVDRIVERRPNDPQSYQRRAVLLLEQKRYLDAVLDADAVVRLVKGGGTNIPLYQALNEAAYFRALADADLDTALHDADEAIAMIRDIRRFRSPTPAETDTDQTPLWQLDDTLAATLDTRGFIYYRLGNLDAAKKDLDEAIDRHERHNQEVTRLLLTSDPLERPYIRAELLGARESLGVMLYHRGLVFSKLGDTRRASQDLAKAAEYGFDVERGH